MIDFLTTISLIGVVERDSIELRLQKQFLVFLAMFMSIGGIIWGSISYGFGLYAQGMIPYSYTIISIFNLIYFYKAKKFDIVKNIQTFISLLLPFFFQWSLGGFASSGTIMFWAILALLASITFQSKTASFVWLTCFLLLTLISGVFDEQIQQLKPAILPDSSTLFLVINMMVIPTIVFGLMLYVVKKQEMTQRVLYEKQEEIINKNEMLKASKEELEQNNEELATVNEELEKTKNNLELIVEERTKNLKENEEKLRVLLKESQETNNQLTQAEEELRQNVEELRTTQEQMRSAKEAAEQANRAKSEFLANMSHEIRTPLNAIVGFSQILLNSGKKHKLDATVMKQLGYIKTGGQNLSELINNILDLSKIESGKMTASFEPLNIKQLFQGIYHINKGKAREKGVNFSFDFDETIPEVVESDRTKLNQILMNLVGNSVKFTPEGKDVIMTAKKSGDYILFRVTDTGIGIDDDKKPIIFDAFEQADTTVTRKFGGSGLGLAITKKMVELLKGEIGFDSLIEVGTTFYVKIPLIESNEILDDEAEFDFSNACFSQDNVILVAEDNKMNREMIKSLFHELKLPVYFAENGKEAIEKTKQLKPDLVLMDMHMPIMGGIDATKAIRQIAEFKDLPIIAVSAEAFAQQQRFAISEGLTDYITKPIDFKKLMPLLCQHLKHDDTESDKTGKNMVMELTEDLKNEINFELIELSNIPTYNFEEIDLQIAKIKELCKGYKTELQTVLKNMEKAFFSGNEEELAKLFKFRV